ncbi:WD40 repeat-containing protein [Schizothecium vesticola]|uniref:WD40 repeat-containing protein n=1 Tax=Schizothecium vesticola TaxID=314040 RepID=A0AA40FAA5_9PEZI|nr:WD40 repeat-containing protein [Schizothecium vesticola]
MAPSSSPPILRPRQGLPKKDFADYFKALKSQPYSDPAVASRGSGSFTHNSLRSIAWNPLGSLVATGSIDKTIRVWNPDKPNVRFSTELKGHSASVEKVAFNPVKDAELASLGADGVVKFWDVRTKASVNEVKGLGTANSMAWDPDGVSLLVSSKGGDLFRISPSQSTVLSSNKQPSDVFQMAFSWEGKRVFTPMRNGRVRILSYPGLEPIAHYPYTMPSEESNEFTLKGHTAPCYTAELSPTGRLLATGGGDSIVALFDTKDWLCQKTISNLHGPVRSISFTFDGNYIAAGCEDAPGIEVVSSESGDHVHTFKTATPSPAVAWAPTRYCLAYSDLGTLRIIGLDTDRK